MKKNVGFADVKEYWNAKTEEFFAPKVMELLTSVYNYTVSDLIFEGTDVNEDVIFFFDGCATFSGEDAEVKGRVILNPSLPPEYWHVPGMAGGQTV